MVDRFTIRFIGVLIAVAALLTMPSLAFSFDGQGELSFIRVANTKGQFLSMKVEKQHAHIEVTPAHISKGYVDIDSAMVLRVRSNRPEGYKVSFRKAGGPFTRVVVLSGEEAVELRQTGAFQLTSYSGGLSGEVIKLGVRLHLADNARPGIYDWPLIAEPEADVDVHPIWSGGAVMAWRSPFGEPEPYAMLHQTL